jgi:hypothetical protein
VVGPELAKLGAPEEWRQGWQARRQREAPESFEVLPENWDAVRLFARTATQWRLAGMSGVRTGLDYPAVRLVARALKLPFALEDLQEMEAAALAFWAEERNRG